MAEPNRAAEDWIVLLVAAVQFVNILDFMMVMPLGPDFARDLNVGADQIGLVGGTYTLAAAIGGILGAGLLDRLDRRTALGLAMAGLAVGTVAGAFAVSLETLLMARALAGVFGGPATSVALSIVADVVPSERRGRAMSRVMAAFSVASVLGVPAGLEIAHWGSWRTPFLVVALASAVITTLSLRSLPSMTGHLGGPRRGLPVRALLGSPRVWAAYTIVALATLSAFSLIPNISAFLQMNLHVPRSWLGGLYMAGGVVSFAVMQAVGRAVDRFGAAPLTLVGVLAYAAVVWAGFIDDARHIPVVVVFMAFMGAQSTRNVAQQTLLSKVPAPSDRAGFMSLQSAVQHVASAFGAFASSAFLVERGGRLEGVPQLAMASIGAALLTPPLFYWLEAKLRPAQGTTPSAARS